MSVSHHPVTWMHNTEQILEMAGVIPAWEGSLDIDWDKLSDTLRQRFGLDELEVRCTKTEWMHQDSLLTSMGEAPFIQALEIAPINAACFFVMPKDDVLRFSRWILTEDREKEAFLDNNLTKGFFIYSLLSGLEGFAHYSAKYALAPQLTRAPLPEEGCYVCDIYLRAFEETLWCRLLLPESFRKKTNVHLAKQKPSLYTIASHSEKKVPCAITCGYTLLQYDAFHAIKKGDFVLLDACSYAPNTGKGSFQLHLFGQPLFQIQLERQQITISDYPIEFEESPMNEETPDEPHIAPEDEGIEGTGVEAEKERDDKLSKAKNVPLKLTVELGSITLPLKQLLELQPGNMLETGIHPEKPVRLTLNGHAVAQGTLMQMGDVVGIRIDTISK